ncbi:MAG: hypothetical protein IPO92_23560 [Saprospiraceae bacterium]|nr:hypothetical protein [Saprospiraceae bacterium]
MIEKNSIVFGLLLGAVVPVFGFIIVEFIFNTLTNFGLMAAVSESSSGRRYRTLLLIAICCSLVPFNMAKNRKWDNTMRGIVFPTLVYVAGWLYKFYGELFN